MNDSELQELSVSQCLCFNFVPKSSSFRHNNLQQPDNTKYRRPESLNSVSWIISTRSLACSHPQLPKPSNRYLN